MRHEEKNIGGGAENPGSDEQKISLMLAGLERVEAPKDFDFHLKARIANARPADYRQGGLFPILKYVMPLALFLVVGAGILVMSLGDAPQPAPVAEAEEIRSPNAAMPDQAYRQPADTEPEPPVQNTTESIAPSKQLAVERRAAPTGSRKVSVRSLPQRDLPVAGSRDITGGSATAPQIRPPEFRQNTNTSSNSSTVPSEMAPKPMSVRDALGSIGIEAELVDNKWKVRSVKSSTIAGQMGVKAGDLVESVDGKEIDNKTEYKDGSFKVKTIRVKRGSSAVDLQMPKPQR